MIFFNPVLETGFHKNTNKNKIIFLTPLAVSFSCLMQKCKNFDAFLRKQDLISDIILLLK